MDCCGGLFSNVANGVSDGVSNLTPVVMTTAKVVAIGLVALVPAMMVAIFAGQDESRKLLGERRGRYHRRK